MEPFDSELDILTLVINFNLLSPNGIIRLMMDVRKIFLLQQHLLWDYLFE